MDIQEYIASGVLESYVLGIASDDEVEELLHYKERYPEIKNALFELEMDMERIAGEMAIKPPADTWERIEADINELAVIPQPLGFKQGAKEKKSDRQSYIEIEAQQTHIRVHKNWKWIFVAVFVLSKVFLICTIYFYLENRQAQQQIKELKTELRLHKTP